jgi:hypothetical protein
MALLHLILLKKELLRDASGAKPRWPNPDWRNLSLISQSTLSLPARVVRSWHTTSRGILAFSRTSSLASSAARLPPPALLYLSLLCSCPHHQQIYQHHTHWSLQMIVSTNIYKILIISVMLYTQMFYMQYLEYQEISI